MNARRMGVATAVFLLSGLASADGRPSFDCAAAKGQVQTMICKDAGLAELDRQLDAVFKAALGKARNSTPSRLRAEQTGRIKGRDECWKAQANNPVRLTLSWTAENVRACIEGNYMIRIADLQSAWRLVPSRTVAYACGSIPAIELVVSFFESGPKSARIEYGDQTVTAFLLPNSSRYEGRGVTLTVRDRHVTVNWHGTSLTCNQN